MSAREPELDQLTTLLGQCLGRIEEHAFRLQDDTWTGDEPAAGDALDDETDLLQELIGSLLVCAVDEHADLNATVQRALQQQLGEVAVPIVVRQRFARDLPKVACTPADATFAVQRALALVLGRLEPGCEVSLWARGRERSAPPARATPGSGATPPRPDRSTGR